MKTKKGMRSADEKRNVNTKNEGEKDEMKETERTREERRWIVV